MRSRCVNTISLHLHKRLYAISPVFHFSASFESPVTAGRERVLFTTHPRPSELIVEQQLLLCVVITGLERVQVTVQDLQEIYTY